MNKLVTAFGFAVLATAAPAVAQSFTGPFVGVQAGWNHDKAGRIAVGDTRADLHRSKDSAVGGLYAGYDLQVGGAFVLGAEADVVAGLKDSVRRNDPAAGSEFDPKYGANLTARAGILLGDNMLVYARGGYALVHASAQVTGKETLSDTVNVQGWTAGGGVERLLGNGLSARAEFRYSDVRHDRSKLQREQVFVGLGYRF